MIVGTKKSIRLETVELVRLQEGVNFMRCVVLLDRMELELVAWYSAPTVTVERYVEEISMILTEYDVQVMTGDFNARHTS